MNLVAPVWPQGSALAGQKWTGGWFTHVFDPTGGEVYEGYNYLGAGVLLVLAAAGLLTWRARRRRSPTAVWIRPAAQGPAPGAAAPDPAAHDPAVGGPSPSWARRWGPLAAALGLLTLYALGTKPYAGTVQLFAVTLPDRPWMEPFALFRCHGRFFWTVGYAFAAGGLVVLDRLSGVRLRTAVLAAAVLLQAADMSQMIGGLHERFSRPDALHAPAALRGPAFRGRDVRVYPGFFCTTSYTNQRLVRQMAIIAQRQGASINTAETARAPLGSCTRPPPADALVDAAPGDRRITVLLGDDGASSAATNPFARRSDCFSYESVWMCGRDLAGVPGLTPVPGRQLIKATHEDLSLALNTPPSNPALLSGWARPELSGVWSEAPRAVLRLPHPELPPGAYLTVTLDALGYQPPGRAAQRAYVSVKGRPLAEWRMEGGGYHGLQVAVPSELLDAGRPLDITLDLPDIVSPDEVLPGSGDARRLGIGVRGVRSAH